MVDDENSKILYLAGLFDGEGCITIGKQKLINGKDRLFTYVRLEMTNREAVSMFADTFGGNVYTHMPRKENCKVSYSHASSGKRAKAMLERIGPHLRVKKSQAETALKFLNLKALKNVPYEKLESLRFGIQALNHA